MRILQLTDAMTVGGSERVTVELANELASRGHDIAVAAGPGPLWGDVAEGVAAFCVPGFPEHGTARFDVMFRRLREIIGVWAPDVVAVHQRRLGLCMRAMQVLYGVQVVEYVHSVFVDHRVLSFRNATTVAIGNSVLEHVLTHYGRPEERVFCIPLGITDRRLDLTGEELPRGSSSVRLIGVGRLVPEKDPDYFGALVASIERRGAKVDARWLGAGPLLDAVQDRWPSVSWEGEVNHGDVRRQIAASDALVITSRKEGLPVVALEALSVGRALLCRDVGSCSDAVENGQSGIVWSAYASPDEAGAELYAKLALGDTGASRSTFIEMGRQGRKLYERTFGIAAMVESTLELYEQRRGGG